jgi:hypothetical protein
MSGTRTDDWTRGGDGRWTNPQIEETTGLAPAPRSWSPRAGNSTATTTAAAVWTRNEHERFLQGLLLYPHGPYERIAGCIGTKSAAEVKSYGSKCLGSEAYKRWKSRRESKQDTKVKEESGELLEEKVKVEPAELPEADVKNELAEEQQPPAMAHSSGGAAVKRHRVRKWLSGALKWCVDALSFRCLRRRKDVTQQRTVRYGSDIPLRYRRRALLGERTYASAPNYAPLTEPESRATPLKSGPWSSDEHERYCEGLELYRYGSWRLIADYVGTRSVRQVMSHAQSIRAKRKRAREGEREHAPSKARSFGLAAAPTRNPTPEEILRASMNTSLPNSCVSGKSDVAGAAKDFHSDVTSISTDVATSTFASKEPSGGGGSGEQEQSLFLASTTTGTTKESDEALQSPLPTKQSCCGRHADEGLDLENEAPLCSPPHDILQGSFLSDEDLLELFNSPQTQLAAQFN